MIFFTSGGSMKFSGIHTESAGWWLLNPDLREYAEDYTRTGMRRRIQCLAPESEFRKE